MMRVVLALGAGLVTATGALAQDLSGDPDAGEGVFRQCQSCHVVVDDEGNTLAGRRAQVGPNLYGVVGRQAGSVEGFSYSDSMAQAGEAGLHWDEESFIAYVQDPTGFLREYLDDSSARGKMTYRLRGEEDAADVYAYLAKLGPQTEGDGAATN